ncbi:MAG: sugar ABC transporter permease [Sphaerochaetaceae bacterium]|nr:sugar ABC transporter permease [Sphaerochaetaceae bacterium]MDD3942691.1 sugar ABC transporter permease [Sphaerochaetaceae bacterium]
MKRTRFRMTQDAKDALVLLSPLLVLTGVFLVFPVASNFYYSLTKWKGLGTPVFIGLENYRQLFQDTRFYSSLKSLGTLVLYIPLGVFLPLVIANILRTGLRGWKAYRALLYLPNIIGPVILGTIFSVMLSQVGPITEILKSLGYANANEFYMLGKSTSAINTLSFLFVVWMRVGFGCIYFLAAMSTIDESLYDAAKIDGTNKFQDFIHITIPGIRFSIEFFTVLAFIEVFARMYGMIFTLTGGGPGYATYTLEFGVYMLSFSAYQKGYASAWAVILFFFCAIIALVQIRLIRKGEQS